MCVMFCVYVCLCAILCLRVCVFMLVVLLYIQNVVDAFLVLGELGWMVLLCVCLCVHSGYLP